jgi:hypothetical protein
MRTKTATKTKTLEIPAPKFELSESVYLYWNTESIETRITDRRYYADHLDGWWYEVWSIEGKYFFEDSLESRS